MKGKLTRWEIERLIQEMTASIRTYLEENLPSHHPLLTALNREYQISTSFQSQIYL